MKTRVRVSRSIVASARGRSIVASARGRSIGCNYGEANGHTTKGRYHCDHNLRVCFSPGRPPICFPVGRSGASFWSTAHLLSCRSQWCLPLVGHLSSNSRSSGRQKSDRDAVCPPVVASRLRLKTKSRQTTWIKDRAPTPAGRDHKEWIHRPRAGGRPCHEEKLV
jgi:hypothetical protein